MFLPSWSEPQQRRFQNIDLKFHKKLGHGQILQTLLLHKTHWVLRCCPPLWPVSTAPRSAGPTDCRRSPRCSSLLAVAAAAAAEGSDPQAGWAHLGDKERGFSMAAEARVRIEPAPPSQITKSSRSRANVWCFCEVLPFLSVSKVLFHFFLLVHLIVALHHSVFAVSTVILPTL